MLESTCDRLENYPELRARFDAHRTVSRRHADIVRQCIERRGGSRSTVKDTAAKLMAFAQGASGLFVGDEVVKAILATSTFEQMKISSYEILKAARRPSATAKRSGPARKPCGMSGRWRIGSMTTSSPSLKPTCAGKRLLASPPSTEVARCAPRADPQVTARSARRIARDCGARTQAPDEEHAIAGFATHGRPASQWQGRRGRSQATPAAARDSLTNSEDS